LQMEKDDKGSMMIRMGVSGWMFLLVPAYPGCPGSKAIKRSLLAGEGFLSAVTLQDQDQDCPEVVSGHFKTKTQGQQHSSSATSYTDLS